MLMVERLEDRSLLSVGLVTANVVGIAAPGENRYGTSNFVLSANGRYVAFVSDADDLVPNDRNRTGDVFVRDLATGTTSLVTVNLAGRAAGGSPSPPSIS